MERSERTRKVRDKRFGSSGYVIEEKETSSPSPHSLKPFSVVLIAVIDYCVFLNLRVLGKPFVLLCYKFFFFFWGVFLSPFLRCFIL
jgi:hypothetical protein